MLRNDKEKAICKIYSAKDEKGKVHCSDCPLVVSHIDLMCKATAHYNHRKKEWEFDDDYYGGACDEDD